MLVRMPSKKRGRPATGRKTPFNLSARATEAHVRALKALAENTRRSVSAEIILAIEAWLAKHKRWPSQAKGTP